MAVAAVTLAAAGYSAYSQVQAANAQQKLADKNADLIDKQATDAVNRGEMDARQERTRTSQVRAAQRVAFATQGVDVGSGTAADLQSQTGELGAINQAQIRDNAFREAWGLNAQASNQRLGGRYAAAAGTNNAIGTAIGGVGQGAEAYYRYDAPRMAGAH